MKQRNNNKKMGKFRATGPAKRAPSALLDASGSDQRAKPATTALSPNGKRAKRDIPR